MKVKMDMPDLPHGFKYTGEWRVPEPGEHYINEIGVVSYFGIGWRCEQTAPIVLPVERDRS